MFSKEWINRSFINHCSKYLPKRIAMKKFYRHVGIIWFLFLTCVTMQLFYCAGFKEALTGECDNCCEMVKITDPLYDACYRADIKLNAGAGFYLSIPWGLQGSQAESYSETEGSGDNVKGYIINFKGTGMMDYADIHGSYDLSMVCWKPTQQRNLEIQNNDLHPTGQPYSIITSPDFFTDASKTFSIQVQTLKDGFDMYNLKESDIAITSNWQVVCFDYNNSQPMPEHSEVPVLEYGSFDEDECAFNLTYSYNFDNLYDTKPVGLKCKIELSTAYEEPKDRSGHLSQECAGYTSKIIERFDDSPLGDDEFGTFRWKPDSDQPAYFQINLQATDDYHSGVSRATYSKIIVLPRDATDLPVDDAFSKKMFKTMPCVLPRMVINKITDKDNNEVLLSGEVPLNLYDPFTIHVESKVDETTKPSSFTVEVLLNNKPEDETDAEELADIQARIDFYEGRTITEEEDEGEEEGKYIVQSFSYAPEELTDDYIYKIPWSARDRIDNRLLLSGKYTIKVTVDYGNNSINDETIKISVAQPEFYNMATRYDETNTHSISDINRASKNYCLGVFEFEDEDENQYLDYLSEVKEDPEPECDPDDESTYGVFAYKFRWLYDFTEIGLSIRTHTDYPFSNSYGNDLDENRMDRIKNRTAILSWLGHAWLTNVAPRYPSINFQNYALFGSIENAACANPNQTFIDSKCVDGNIKMRGDLCDPDDENSHRKPWMDEILLAVLVGCWTALDGEAGEDDEPSMARQMIEHGADCAIGTLRKVQLEIMNFWYYNFYNMLFDKERTDNTISASSEAAYKQAIDDLCQCVPAMRDNTYNNNLAQIISYFGTTEDSRSTTTPKATIDVIASYQETIRLLNNENNAKQDPTNEASDPIDVRTKRIFPARFGSAATSKCPESEPEE